MSTRKIKQQLAYISFCRRKFNTQNRKLHEFTTDLRNETETNAWTDWRRLLNTSDISTSVTSTSTTAAASSSAVKQAYDLANHSHSYLPLTGGTLTAGLSGTTGSFSGTVTSNGRAVFTYVPRQTTENINNHKLTYGWIGTWNGTANEIGDLNHNWLHILNFWHSDNNGYNAQIALPLNDVTGKMYFRLSNSSTFADFRTVMDTRDISTSTTSNSTTLVPSTSVTYALASRITTLENSRTTFDVNETTDQMQLAIEQNTKLLKELERKIHGNNSNRTTNNNSRLSSRNNISMCIRSHQKSTRPARRKK